MLDPSSAAQASTEAPARRARVLGWARAASAAVVIALVAVAGFAGLALEQARRDAAEATRDELTLLDDVECLQELLYQKGFSAEFMLTQDQRWLDELAASTGTFVSGLARVERETRSPSAAQVVRALSEEYARYDADRTHALALFRAGARDEALAAQAANRTRAARLKALADELLAARRAELEAQSEDAARRFRRSLAALVGFAALAIAVAAAAGFGLARRVGRPLYELVLRAEAAAPARVELSADDEIAAIASHVTHLAREVEASSRALAEERARAVQAEKLSALGEMAAAVAHEVLNPLTGIKVAMQLLARVERSTLVQETTAAVDAEISRVDRVARRLISFARPLSVEAEPVDLGAVVERAVRAVSADRASSQVDFVLDVSGAPPLYADPDLLEQVLVNLTLNACQAMVGAGRVTVRSRAEAPWRAIDVIDDGPGIAPEIGPLLFLPFTTSRADGHGLGLALSQSIAVAHGGRIEARSNAPARGATFTVYLPEAPR